jgi:hypothetical protein
MSLDRMPRWTDGFRCRECRGIWFTWIIGRRTSTGIMSADGRCRTCPVRVSIRWDDKDHYKAILTDLKIPNPDARAKRGSLVSVHGFLSEFVQGF